MALAFLANLKDKLKLVAGIVVAILILKILRKSLGKATEEDEEDFENFTEIFKKLIEESKKKSSIPLSQWQQQNMSNYITNEAINSYNRLVGFIYKYPDDSGKIRLDIKDRFFEKSPSCYIRRYWNTEIPSGLTIPTPSNNKTEVSADYSRWVDCLREKRPECQALLEDYRKRFLFDECPKADLNYNPDTIQLRLVPDWFPRLK